MKFFEAVLFLNICSRMMMKLHQCALFCPERLLAHNFQPAPPAKFSSCEVCHKGFTGYMKHALKCLGKLVHNLVSSHKSNYTPTAVLW